MTSPVSDPYRCRKCGTWLVAIALADGTAGVWPYEGLKLEQVCPKCQGLLECVDVVRGWFRRKQP
jgi:hypothetical protein